MKRISQPEAFLLCNVIAQAILDGDSVFLQSDECQCVLNDLQIIVNGRVKENRACDIDEIRELIKQVKGSYEQDKLENNHMGRADYCVGDYRGGSSMVEIWGTT